MHRTIAYYDRYWRSVLLPLCMYVRLSVCFYLLTFDYVCYLMFIESVYFVFCILCAAFWHNKRWRWYSTWRSSGRFRIVTSTPNVTYLFEIQHHPPLQFTEVRSDIDSTLTLFAKRACVLKFTSCYLNIGDNWCARLNGSAFRNVFCAVG